VQRERAAAVRPVPLRAQAMIDAERVRLRLRSLERPAPDAKKSAMRFLLWVIRWATVFAIRIETEGRYPPRGCGHAVDIEVNISDRHQLWEAASTLSDFNAAPNTHDDENGKTRKKGEPK